MLISSLYPTWLWPWDCGVGSTDWGDVWVLALWVEAAGLQEGMLQRA